MPKNKGSGRKKWKDSDDAPALTREFFRTADVYRGEKLVRRGRPSVGARPKEAVKLRLSPDVLDHFRSGGPGMLGERLDLRDDTLPLLLGGQGLDFLGCGCLDKELIGGHAA